MIFSFPVKLTTSKGRYLIANPKPSGPTIDGAQWPGSAIGALIGVSCELVVTTRMFVC